MNWWDTAMSPIQQVCLSKHFQIFHIGLAKLQRVLKGQIGFT